jgi:hypothetical protein
VDWLEARFGETVDYRMVFIIDSCHAGAADRKTIEYVCACEENERTNSNSPTCYETFTESVIAVVSEKALEKCHIFFSDVRTRLRERREEFAESVPSYKFRLEARDYNNMRPELRAVFKASKAAAPHKYL